jgi:nucleotide-binding universal stress UspA family protein
VVRRINPVFVKEMKMHNVRKILVPIDFSPESGRALRDAAALARETGAQLIAFHVIDEKAERDILLSFIAPVGGLPFLIDGSAIVHVDVLMRERTLDLWNFIDRHAGPINQDRIRKVVRMGKLAKVITAFMRDEAVDLLVLRLRQRRWFPDFTTLKLISMAGRLCCPVLLDPPAARYPSEPSNGLLSFDLLAQVKLLSSRAIIKPMTS